MPETKLATPLVVSDQVLPSTAALGERKATLTSSFFMDFQIGKFASSSLLR
jgi:hypothetical protein